MRARSLLGIGVAVALAAACGSGTTASVGSPDGGSASSSGGGSGGSSGGSSGGVASSTSSGSGGSSGSSGGGSSSSSGSTSSSGSGGDAGACGTCPNGFTCSAAGYCVNGHGVPAFDHVYVIVMENASQSTITGNKSAPYINGLMAKYAYTKNYNTTYHPSLPNYINMTSGLPQAVGCDCDPVTTEGACASFCLGGCSCILGDTHLGDQLDGAKIEWRDYGEGMGTPCNTTAPESGNAQSYAPKHIPFLYYQDVNSNSSRCQQRVVDYSNLAADVKTGSYRYSIIAPNLCNDMHNSCQPLNDNVKQGDTWLGTEVPKLLATPGFAAGGKDVLFVVWDEEDNSIGSAPILNIIVSPLVKPGATTNTAYNHESLLATIEDSFGLARLANAAKASPINDVWK